MADIASFSFRKNYLMHRKLVRIWMPRRVGKVQQSLAANSKDINARATLLAYYANAKNTNELRNSAKARLEQIAWLAP